MHTPAATGIRHEALRIAGEKVYRDRVIEVTYPYTGEVIATVPKADLEDVRRALRLAHQYRSTLTRYDRYRILMRAGELIAQRKEEMATLITLESGLSLKDTLYEVGRASDVLLFAANQALVDDGQVFSCDLTPHGKSRKVYTLKEPLLGAISAITPFNHPLNQVIHKVAPAVATNNRIVLKPSEKTPLAAFALADILYEAGLPPQMLSVVTGDPREIADELLTSPHVDLVTFTGGVPIGKYIAAKAAYKRQVLELGGNDPIIVMEDAELEEAATLAAGGSYKNSGQRCTAVKRMLVQESVADRFVELLVARTQAVKYGDPLDPATDMGTVIDEAAAIQFESVVNAAIAGGARLLAGHKRDGALYAPTVMLREGQILYTYLHLAPDPEQCADLVRSGAVCIAYETVTQAGGGLPLLAPMSEVAGRMSVQAGAHCLEKARGGMGVLLGGVAGVEPAKIVILGGGVVGSNAAQIAVGTGAQVVVIDRNIDVLRRMDRLLGARVTTVYSNQDNLERHVLSADLVIGGVLIPGAAAPKLVSAGMVDAMKPGSVIVDVAIDQGGCCETARATTHADPTYLVGSVLHYCVANMPGAVPRTSTYALNNATLPFALQIADKGWKTALADNPHLANGLNVAFGKVTCKEVAHDLGYAYHEAAQLLTH
ncbi:phosphonoacetaldehyde dehydrogenase [Cupriavidus taiwanensis]|uniref:phosphonoacetaldehyde dehydrogenase n=1 Tax=Cupriavidus taiwanensis TaxID=164546 RepID=UPI000E1A4319|nr:phosphonoacetaldehyde dehydrogenase [Cupriavidus taiwanensis]SOZ28044.1 Alanine dehydrogenase (modular protein) [Cupriavidus taiwanensis]SPA32281.1 Alanine dehydrogenase (modular protein) [Cupriavidus taiwanensis]